jgi:hypothetical protein
MIMTLCFGLVTCILACNLLIVFHLLKLFACNLLTAFFNFPVGCFVQLLENLLHFGIQYCFSSIHNNSFFGSNQLTLWNGV